MAVDEGQTALHVAVSKGHLEMVRLLLEGGANVNKPDVRGRTPKSLATTSNDSCHPGGEVKKPMKRVTIHANFRKNTPEKQFPKLIVLPESLEELLIIAGQKFGGQKFAKVLNSESAEVDDLSVIKDEDHLFFLPNDC